jgi:hypothetical protein
MDYVSFAVLGKAYFISSSNKPYIIFGPKLNWLLHMKTDDFGKITTGITAGRTSLVCNLLAGLGIDYLVRNWLIGFGTEMEYGVNRISIGGDGGKCHPVLFCFTIGLAYSLHQ